MNRRNSYNSILELSPENLEIELQRILNNNNRNTRNNKQINVLKKYLKNTKNPRGKNAAIKELNRLTRKKYRR
jgi:hypothetical protein